MILILFFVPYRSSRYFIHRPDTLLTFMSIHLTDWFFPILPECSRIIQDHPLGISTMLKRGKIGLKYDRKRLPRHSACSTQGKKRPISTIYPLIFNELKWLSSYLVWVGVKFSNAKEEELLINDASQIGSKKFDFSIE